MKKKSICIILIIVSISAFFVWNYYHDKYEYAPVKEYYSINSPKQSELRVGVVGDSWVVRQDLKKLLREKFELKSVKASIVTSGNPGGRSKNIYENLFKPVGELYSSKEVIESSPKYCIVISGINDAVTQSGPEFYAYHMTLIVKTLLHYNSTPVIVNIPRVGLDENFAEKSGFVKFSNKISSAILNNGEDLTVDDYRNQLVLELKKENLLNKVIMVNPDEVGIDYKLNRKEFWDPLHMNEVGYEKFSTYLAQKIVDLEK